MADDGVPAPGVIGGSMAGIDVAGTTDPATGAVHLSIVNRHRDDVVDIRLDGVSGVAQLTRLFHDDIGAENTAAEPNKVVPVSETVTVDGSLVVAPHSHTTLLFTGR